MDPNCMEEMKKTALRTVRESLVLPRADGGRIPVLVSLPADEDGRPAAVQRVVLIVHGMGSSKEAASSEYYRLFFNQAGLGAVLYDQPGMGGAEAAEEDIRVAPSLDSLAAVERYARDRFPEADLVYFGSSYGAYITGLYVRTRPHLGRRAFFRSGAVIFPEMITGGPGAQVDPKAQAALDARGYLEVDLGADAPLRFVKGFLEELMDPAYDLLTLYREALPDVPIAMAHGDQDPEVPPAHAKAFAEAFGIPFTMIPGEGHSLCSHPETPAKVGQLALDWFEQA